MFYKENRKKSSVFNKMNEYSTIAHYIWEENILINNEITVVDNNK